MRRKLSNVLVFLFLTTVVISYVLPFLKNSDPLLQCMLVGGRPVVGQFRVSGDSETRPRCSNSSVKLSATQWMWSLVGYSIQVSHLCIHWNRCQCEGSALFLGHPG